MPEYPLLLFPEQNPGVRAKRGSGPSKIKIPSAQKQATRLAPQFQRLQQAMDRQRLMLQNNALGIQPEQTLVLETVGPVEDFVKAVSKINGLEWLGEFEIDDIAPDHDFEDTKESEKHLKGQLFLVMTDQRALRQLQKLFDRWKDNPDAVFPYGLTPLKKAFIHLYRIRPWDQEDRIRDTGLIEDWRFRIQDGQQMVPFETELWFRENPIRRQQAGSYLQSLIEELGGEVVQQAVISEIAYHGILGKIPMNQVAQILDQQEVRLLQCEDIMYLRPIGQCAVRLIEDTAERDLLGEGVQPDLPQGDPIVALLDGLPLTGHRLLNGWLIVDDPDGYESAYQASERVHGTAMASLICHGDLNEDSGLAQRPLYVRPILKPNRSFDGRFIETIPEKILPVDLVHRAVRRLFETEGGDLPAAPTVRIVSLSVCDRSRPLDRNMSPWARLVDWLSWKYNVLFVVSAGNHLHEIELNVPRAELQNLNAEDRETAVIKAIAADTRHRRLLSPAETFNGITVGASHEDASTRDVIPNLINPFSRVGLPSTISAQGPGYRRTIKPDILLPGGRQLLSEKLGNTHANAVLQTRVFNRPPGQQVATPGSSGELDRTIHTRGTSNAAALASRWAASLFDVINQCRVLPGASLHPEYDVVLIKALLVHGADWAETGELYESILKNAQNSRTFKNYVSRFFGYGSANIAKVMGCTDQRVTVLGVGKLGDGEAHELLLPLPPSLSATTERRRLTITLAWLTPVNSKRQNYRVAHLWFNPKNRLTPSRICADHRAVQRGTIQHEVLEGDKAIDFQDGETIVIKVNCRADADTLTEPIRYGLAVTLEVGEGIDIPIYLEVKDRLHVRVPIQGVRASATALG